MEDEWMALSGTMCLRVLIAGQGDITYYFSHLTQHWNDGKQTMDLERVMMKGWKC
jgi:hypothetical protein